MENVTNEIDATIDRGRIESGSDIGRTQAVIAPSTLTKMIPTSLQANKDASIEDANTRRKAVGETRSEGIEGSAKTRL